MRRVSLAGVLTASLATVGLAGCSADVSEPAATTTPVATQGASSPSTPVPSSPAPEGLVNDDTGEVIGEAESPRWNAAAREAAREAAVRAMTAFARPGLGAEQWWDELEPLLSTGAAEDYAYVDPANVPARQVTGRAKLIDETSAYVARVEVATDVGTYTLVLSRSDGESPWLVERITPPEGGR